MSKYGLNLGIKNLETRHMTVSEYYRNQKEKSNNLQINIGQLLQQKEAKQKAL